MSTSVATTVTYVVRAADFLEYLNRGVGVNVHILLHCYRTPTWCPMSEFVDTRLPLLLTLSKLVPGSLFSCFFSRSTFVRYNHMSSILL